ncbi:hypothetical protein LTR91_021803 [Friedmanniomyces endolithicus]|uniref:Uncharacterized protein n=2 Tax=Dothideomycetidae TaxID=451867 RepID=A0AAN6H5A0_9PEZI|nr:hypothetical protein LTR94_022566 [Friedmanniomyces endolithicus]KAK5140312.1 hypothetical protein LTR32_006850 [Rachicladosporium monterosium]KAK0837879.1 hypothetical protein LTS02_017883 [Friedmanniomyces endolithicus]KAK0890768.1 hypothetical protein LTR57_025008 [Friedmanniomyces endolithicus]KAK0939950.1 hypothetical protein LTR29_008552 [Friedmanniomyces endolithicus]
MASPPFAKGKASSLMAEFEASSSHRSLAKLRDLDPTAILLLFTPVMVPAGYLKDQQRASDEDAQVDSKAPVSTASRAALLTTDPFEMLGIALSKQHSRVRHVPYVPSVGFTDTHDHFLEKAHAVLVVSCEPTISAGASPGTDLEFTLAKQAEFVGCVATELEESGRQVPMVNLSFGGDEWENQVPTYSRIWVGEKYDAESVVNVVKLVFDR